MALAAPATSAAAARAQMFDAATTREPPPGFLGLQRDGIACRIRPATTRRVTSAGCSAIGDRPGGRWGTGRAGPYRALKEWRQVPPNHPDRWRSVPKRCGKSRGSIAPRQASWLLVLRAARDREGRVGGAEPHAAASGRIRGPASGAQRKPVPVRTPARGRGGVRGGSRSGVGLDADDRRAAPARRRARWDARAARLAATPRRELPAVRVRRADGTGDGRGGADPRREAGAGARPVEQRPALPELLRAPARAGVLLRAGGPNAGSPRSRRGSTPTACSCPTARSTRAS